MKFSAVALSFAATVAAAIVSPFGASAEYVCHTDVTFQNSVDVQPSNDELQFFEDTLVEAGRQAYANNADMNLDYEKLEEYHIGPSVSSLINKAMKMLRGSKNGGDADADENKNLLGSGWWIGGSIGWSCHLCDDDDAVMGSRFALPGQEFAEALQSSQEHRQWEALLCEMVTGNDSSAWSITGCSITLTNCHIENDFDEAETENEAVDVVADVVAESEVWFSKVAAGKKISE